MTSSQLSALEQIKLSGLLHEQAFINNQWVSSTERFEVINPANQQALAQVVNVNHFDVDKAILGAQKAYKIWSNYTANDRANCLHRWFELIMQHKESLALLLTLEQGKPLREAEGEIIYGAKFIEWFAEQAKRIEGQILQSPWSDKRLLVMKQAVGVCAAITPWNFPFAMVTRKIAPAIAAGCSVIVKPAEQTPLCATALAELAKRAGIPAGVIQVLTANSEQSIAVGSILCQSPIIRHLSFTGSTATGRILMQQCANTVKRLALELGGHAPFIVFADADLACAIEAAVQSKYRNAGQTCVCTNRFYVHESLYEAFLSGFAKAIAKIEVGFGIEAHVHQGPLIDQDALHKVKEHVADALHQGARLLVGGHVHELGGYFYQPTLLADTKPAMLIMREETFGPVAAVCSFRNDDEVVELANATEFGLAAYFFSRDMNRIWRIAEQLEYGMIGVNTGMLSSEVAPFGGIKQSGFGREGSQIGIEEYLDTKYVCLGAIS